MADDPKPAEPVPEGFLVSHTTHPKKRKRRYAPDTDPVPHRARFFARIERTYLELACPGCGTVARIDRLAKCFDPIYQRFICPACGRRWLLGLTAEPARRHPPINLSADLIPTLTEAEQLRGLRTRMRNSRWDPRNRLCSCAGRDFYYDFDPTCELHKDEDRQNTDYHAWLVANPKI